MKISINVTNNTIFEFIGVTYCKVGNLSFLRIGSITVFTKVGNKTKWFKRLN